MQLKEKLGRYEGYLENGNVLIDQVKQVVATA